MTLTGEPSTQYRVTVFRELGPECPSDPECYYCDHLEAVQLVDSIIDSEHRWPHMSALRVIEVTAFQMGARTPIRVGIHRPPLPLDQLSFFDGEPGDVAF